MNDIAKLLILFGSSLVLIGVCVLFLSRFPWLGKLPGDIVIKRENFSFYFPLATSVLISLVLSFVLYLFRRH